MSKAMAKKLNITIREDLLARVDDFVEGHGMTRSGLISIALAQYLNAVEAAPALKLMLNGFAAVSDGLLKGEMSEEEAKARLAQVQAAYASLSQNSLE